MADFHQITIVSGGQSGADRAALDFALDHGIPHGGWCPRGRRAEDGPLAAKYGLQETPSRRYSQRTEWNVRDSDATVVFSIAQHPGGGTALTLAIARRSGKPCLHLSREDTRGSQVEIQGVVAEAAGRLSTFLQTHAVARLNVAGPRASQEPEIGSFVRSVLELAHCTSAQIGTDPPRIPRSR